MSLSTGQPGYGRYALIPTHNRHAMLDELVERITPEVDMIVVVDNASSPPVNAIDLRFQPEATGVIVVYDSEQPPNLSRLWNVGFDQIANHATLADESRWDVAVLNDDALPPAGWFARTADKMREYGAGAACVKPMTERLLTEPRPGLFERMDGSAFIVRGELTRPGGQLRADERLRWWGGDNQLDMNARSSGGMLILHGEHVPNRHANQSTVGVLAEQAGRDRETFREINGWYGW